MLLICGVVLMIVLAMNILDDLKAVDRCQKRSRDVFALQKREKSAAYDWNKEKIGAHSIIAFDDLRREEKEVKLGRESTEEIYFLDACANFGESPAKREDKLIFFSDIKNF